MDTTPQLEDHIEIDAPPQRVWDLVHDVRRMAQWSPQVESTRLRADADRVAQGTRFTSRNVDGELAWITHGEVVRFAPETEIAFRVEENGVVWSLTLDPLESGGTLLRQRRETPEGISATSLEMTETYMGGSEAFTARMRAGMRETLENIKAAAGA